MATSSVTYRCPSCDAPLAFNATTGRLSCEYCESSFTVEEVERFFAQKQQAAEDKADAVKDQDTKNAEQAEARSRVEDANQRSARSAEAQDPIQAYLDSKRTLNESDPSTTAVQCSSCGATLIVSDTSAVTCCPYCGNNGIVPGKLGNTLEPDYVIPFKTTKQQAIDKLTAHYNGKICLPKAFKDKNHIEEIQGVYVPFWLYSGDTVGSATFTCTDIRVWSDSKFNYTETSTFRAERSGSCSFSLVPADGSKRMPNDHMDSIEPYDYSEMKPFSTAYLPGFAADRYDESVKDCSERVKSRMETTLTDELAKTVTNHQTITLNDSTQRHEINDVKYALLPVWMLHTKWEGKDFLFAMNGQTGKLIGDLPLDAGKLNLISLGAFAGTFALAFAAALLLL